MKKFYDADASENKGGNPDSQDNTNKVEKNYNDTIEKLSAILGQPVAVAAKRGKVKQDAVSKLVEEMFNEEQKVIIESVKTGLKDNLTKFVEMNKEIGKQRKALEQLELQKKKEFTESCKTLFDKIEGIPELQKEYILALKSTTT